MTTIAALLVVYSDAVPGREAEFNDWYTHVHIRDVMRIPGALAVQRFELCESGSTAPPSFLPGGARYLAIYAFSDTRKAIDVHLDDCFSERMPISDSLDVGKSQDTFYEPVDRLFSAPDADRTAGEAGLVLIASATRPSREKKSASGIADGQVYERSRTQLMPTGAPRFLGIYPATRRPLSALTAIGGAACEFAHYRALMPRLTAQEVLCAGPKQRAIESLARAALGDRLHRFSLREIRSALQAGSTAP
jgi:hypothetical protein